MDEYTEHFITTFTGKKFHYLNPQPDEIDIRDIAHALSLTCRFGGHVREFYSVSEHSVRVALELPKVLRLSGLLHDAHEAYLHDVPRPIKRDMPGYKNMADTIQAAINKKFALISFEKYSIINWADDTLLSTEARDLMTTTQDWTELPPPLEEEIFPWTATDAEFSFLDYFNLWRNDGTNS